MTIGKKSPKVKHFPPGVRSLRPTLPRHLHQHRPDQILAAGTLQQLLQRELSERAV